MVATVLAAGVAFACFSPLAEMPSASAAAQHVTNGTFDSNTAGWKTNSSSQILKHVTAGHTGAAAALSVSTGSGNAVLNDAKATVASAEAGQEFTVSAWVKADKPGINGHLRVRAVAKNGTETHQQYFSLGDSKWTKVNFSFTNKTAGAKLDLNVVAYDLAASNSLLVDDITLISGSQSPETETSQDQNSDAKNDISEASVGGSLTNGGTYNEIGIPSQGAYFGSAIGSNSDPAAFEKQAGSKLGIRRTFYQAGQVKAAVNNAKSDLAQNRLPWISFKLPYSWSEMAAGKGDAWAKDLVKQLDALDGPVWVAFHHEPEGDADIKDWVAMQKHLSPIVKNNSDNIAFTTILTGWNQLYGDAKYSLENTWPGDGLVDVIGFDVYNSQDVVKNGKTQKATDMDGSYFKHFQAFAKKHNVRWGLAETGLNDSAAKSDTQWMQRTYDQLVARDGVAFTYFNTTLNSISSWAISDSVKTKQFADVLKDSTKIK